MAHQTLCDRALRRDLAIMLQNQDYDAVIEELRSGRADVNECLNVRSAEMTGLEHSVYDHDWRMAAIFVLHGADPARNEFTRLLQMFDFSAGEDNPVLLEPSFSHPDFGGLRALVDDDDELSLAYLWLMEACYRGQVACDGEVAHFLDVLDIICGDWFDREAFQRNLQNKLSAMKIRGVSYNDARTTIQDHILRLAQGVLEGIAFEKSIEFDQFLSKQENVQDEPKLTDEK
eukprot:CAMPEP_0183312626 /NCGR_PEP_ID=MMETSP0160_2-20130417/42400_1 /TAXON_ID=2839 ORGANISM="Odontella Sinensis, Strain Grunow 1884" /NCGR_SAMPLE_ID=MMETSP0160_2 /ASSEMBLY_ACC=CAM_ASM_000250 /LENGTH=230 /DNA_ID=CAMNT_0025477517 /DNA_START=164 /DNA_END=856 /DNA_ORIENTATION=-